MIATTRTPPSYIYMVEQVWCSGESPSDGKPGRYYSLGDMDWKHVQACGVVEPHHVRNTLASTFLTIGIRFGSNSDWYYKYLGMAMHIAVANNDIKVASTWPRNPAAGRYTIFPQMTSCFEKELELRPQVWNDVRGVSVCANLSSVSASIMTPRGKIEADWNCPGGYVA